MSKFYSLWAFIRRYKYPVLIIGILLVVGILDENSFWNRQKRKANMNLLQSEIIKNREEYEEADDALRELDGNPEAMEKIARERYFMKRENEDVFVIINPKANSDVVELNDTL